MFLKSTQNGLLKNVQQGISRPLGSREIKKKQKWLMFCGAHCRLCGFSKPIRLFYTIKSDLKWLKYYGNIIASHYIFWETETIC